MSDRPYFLWWDDARIPESGLRERLRSPDAAERALWASRLMREASLGDVSNAPGDRRRFRAARGPAR